MVVWLSCASIRRVSLWKSVDEEPFLARDALVSLKFCFTLPCLYGFLHFPFYFKCPFEVHYDTHFSSSSAWTIAINHRTTLGRSLTFAKPPSLQRNHRFKTHTKTSFLQHDPNRKEQEQPHGSVEVIELARRASGETDKVTNQPKLNKRTNERTLY